jgi:hypothetical protein
MSEQNVCEHEFGDPICIKCGIRDVTNNPNFPPPPMDIHGEANVGLSDDDRCALFLSSLKGDLNG